VSYSNELIDEVMFLYDEEREPMSRIAYIMNVPMSVVDEIICGQIAKFTVEVA
jgi:hypothetical protein